MLNYCFPQISQQNTPVNHMIISTNKPAKIGAAGR